VFDPVLECEQEARRVGEMGRVVDRRSRGADAPSISTQVMLPISDSGTVPKKAGGRDQYGYFRASAKAGYRRYLKSLPLCWYCRRVKLAEKKRREVGLCAECEKRGSYAKD